MTELSHPLTSSFSNINDYSNRSNINKEMLDEIGLQDDNQLELELKQEEEEEGDEVDQLMQDDLIIPDEIIARAPRARGGRSKKGSKLKKIRITSCQRCRRSKERCSRTNPCSSCHIRGIECIWLDGVPHPDAIIGAQLPSTETTRSHRSTASINAKNRSAGTSKVLEIATIVAAAAVVNPSNSNSNSSNSGSSSINKPSSSNSTLSINQLAQVSIEELKNGSFNIEQDGSDIKPRMNGNSTTRAGKSGGSSNNSSGGEKEKAPITKRSRTSTGAKDNTGNGNGKKSGDESNKEDEGSGDERVIKRRNRRITSCEKCRSQKLKCSRTQPCTSCSIRNEECIWLDGVPHQAASTMIPEQTQVDLTQLNQQVATLTSKLAAREAQDVANGIILKESLYPIEHYLNLNQQVLENGGDPKVLQVNSSLLLLPPFIPENHYSKQSSKSKSTKLEDESEGMLEVARSDPVASGSSSDRSYMSRENKIPVHQYGLNHPYTNSIPYSSSDYPHFSRTLPPPLSPYQQPHPQQSLDSYHSRSPASIDQQLQNQDYYQPPPSLERIDSIDSNGSNSNSIPISSVNALLSLSKPSFSALSHPNRTPIPPPTPIPIHQNATKVKLSNNHNSNPSTAVLLGPGVTPGLKPNAPPFKRGSSSSTNHSIQRSSPKPMVNLVQPKSNSSVSSGNGKGSSSGASNMTKAYPPIIPPYKPLSVPVAAGGRPIKIPVVNSPPSTTNSLTPSANSITPVVAAPTPTPATTSTSSWAPPPARSQLQQSRASTIDDES